ncbi:MULTISPECIES: DUF6188 family protein [Mycolicibacterium]|jgi:hypothetical protein|uniref:DUF6188 family protein n=1 Tax=Mycolicibacterium TaxID=1866885 RepID=UPI001CA33986|nr:MULTISPECIES: DUF6188 family protein [Mycolicibacterium]MDW5614059.1 DUF6188 family protein [Mycolicibacterium sp. D5.8-2]QZT57906.1 DUF6188 family protein [Mycolicibacterium austroafricanum]
MDLGLNGKSLQSVLIEYTLRMQLSDVYFIVIESPFNVDSHGESVSLSPEEDADEAFQPIRQLVGQTVEEATADETGALRVRFSDGTRLEVPPDEAYEAWSVSGPNGALVVCTPGGKLAIWSASSES